MMLINPEKMVMIYKGAKFDSYEFERGYERGMTSRITFFAPICGRCLYLNRLTSEEKQVVVGDQVGVSCGVKDCTNVADYFISFDFGFEEGDVEEQKEDLRDPMENLYDAELNFD